MKIPVQAAPALWGAVGGAVVLAIVGFTWFGWVTGGTAEKLAKERTESALVAALTPICVDNFRQSAEAAKNSEALKKISYYWEKGSFVEKGGWATFPGSDTPNSAVARACAEALEKNKL
jgi:hypothetical protein